MFADPLWFLSLASIGYLGIRAASVRQPAVRVRGLLLINLIVSGMLVGPTQVASLLAFVIASYLCARIVEAPRRGRDWILFTYIGAAVGLFATVKTGGLAPSFAPLGFAYALLQNLSYVLDCRFQEAGNGRDRLGSYLAANTLFFNLTAGPIARPKELLPQVERWERPDLAVIRAAVLRIAYGFFKVGIGSVLGVYTALSPVSGKMSLAAQGIWGLCIMARFYADFSGYSDVAIGLGRLFGITLPENFDRPYTVSSVAEFWRRWHISLGAWFRDYVYTPLYLSLLRRVGPDSPGSAAAVNGVSVLVSFALIGLWHGFGVPFLAWGILNGLCVIVHQRSEKGGPAGRFLTLGCVAFGQVLLTLQEHRTIGAYRWLSFVGGAADLVPWTLICVVALVLPHALDRWLREREWLREGGMAYFALTLSFALFFLLTFRSGSQFIYATY